MNKNLLRDYARTSREPITLAQAEAEIYRIVRRVCRSMRYAYQCSYHEPADIEQEAFLKALELLETGKYDVQRPLENFLRVHLSRRLFNFRRNEQLIARRQRPIEQAAPVESPEPIDEAMEMLSECIPMELKSDYARLLGGVRLPKKRRRKVQRVVQELLLDGEYLNGENQSWLARQNY